ncbi:ATP-binding protein [Bacteroidota bacterium]
MSRPYSFRDTRYLVLIIFIGISSIVPVGGYFYYNYRKELRREERLNDLKAIADLKESQMLQWKEERMSDALNVTDNPFIRRNLVNIFPVLKPSFFPIIKAYLNETERDFDYHHIYLVSREGNTIYSTNTEDTLSNAIIRRYQDISMNDKSVQFSGFELNNNSVPYLNLLAPLYQGETYVGFMLLQLDPQKYLFPLIQGWPTPSQSSETLIFSVENDTVVFLNELRHLPNSAFRTKIPLSEKSVAAVMAVDGIRGFVEAADYIGHPIIAYLKKIPGTDWYMVAKTDQEEIFSPMKSETILISGMLILLVVFIGFISYLFLRNHMNSFFIKQVNDELGLRSSEDVSQRKRYEQQIQKLNRLYLTLININQAIFRATDSETMLRELCNILIAKGGYRMVSVGIFEKEKMEVIAAAGHVEGYYDHITISNDELHSGRGPSGMAFKTGNLVVCQDIDSDPVMADWRDEALQRGYRSSAAFPIVSKDELFGVMNIYSSTVDWFDAEEIALLEQLANEVGYAIGYLFVEREREEIREELEASEKKFSQVFESMNDGVAIHELVFDETHTPVDYRLLDVNPMFVETTSIPSEKAVGAIATELYQVSPPPFFDIYKEVALTGKPTVLEVFFEPMNKHFRISVFSQEKNGFTTVFQDVSEQVEARKYLQKMNTELEKRVAERTTLLETANRELESFAYSVSHDLKTPLRSIIGFSAILEERYNSALDDTGKHFLKNIIQGGKNMNQLIEDLLRYSRLGQLKPELSSVDLKVFLKTCISDLQAIIDSVHAELTLPSETVFIKGNIMMLNQIFTNLIVNGITYQPEGQTPEIDISWVEEEKYVIISVKDNGIGISDKFNKKIFQMFQRLHREDQYQGTGIGLAIVKKAVEMHDGEVWVSHSELGAGSTFCVKLYKSYNL